MHFKVVVKFVERSGIKCRRYNYSKKPFSGRNYDGKLEIVFNSWLEGPYPYLRRFALSVPEALCFLTLLHFNFRLLCVLFKI